LPLLPRKFALAVVLCAATALVGCQVASVGTRAAALPNVQKGVAVWPFRGVDAALAKSKALWYYNWATSHPNIRSAPAPRSCR
jgi:hypothetical protein